MKIFDVFDIFRQRKYFLKTRLLTDHRLFSNPSCFDNLTINLNSKSVFGSLESVQVVNAISTKEPERD